MLPEFVDIAKVHNGGTRGVDGVMMRPGSRPAGDRVSGAAGKVVVA